MKWAGRCPECGAWGTLTASAEVKGQKSKVKSSGATPELMPLGENRAKSVPRIPVGSEELSRVLGGGLVPGSVLLLAGEPGIGKSTLVLTILHDLAKQAKVIYASGEESPEQIGARAERLGVKNSNILLTSDQQIENLVAALEELKPAIAVVDSIQTARTDLAEGEAGTPNQIRSSAALLAEAAKRLGIAVIIVGQVTKDGSVAGPKMLEHLVDVVLSLEGDSNGALRVLRANKNRFGSTSEVGLFGMTERGLIDVTNPSALLLKERVIGASGSAVTCIIEGTRPIFVEVQALASPTNFQFPVRKTSGVDLNRLHLILAVLAKRLKIDFSHDDIHVNAVGGVDVKDPSADLAIALALVSSKFDRAVPEKAVAFGEIGLTGELRSTPFVDRRTKEAKKLGFDIVVAPGPTQKTLQSALTTLKLI